MILGLKKKKKKNRETESHSQYPLKYSCSGEYIREYNWIVQGNILYTSVEIFLAFSCYVSVQADQMKWATTGTTNGILITVSQ